MASDCEMELCPNWSGDGWSCPCAVLGLDRPVFDLDPPEPERCEADFNPDGGYDGVCLARLDRHGTCSRKGGYHDDVTGGWVSDSSPSAALRGDQP